MSDATAASSFVAAASSSSPPSASATQQLLSWLCPFGVTSESTGLIVWEGCGPEERGLRTTRRIHSAHKPELSSNVESKPAMAEAPCTCANNAANAAASSASVAAADSAVSPAPYGQSSCASCFSSSPIVAPLISIPQSLLITPDRVRASALIKCLLGRHAARASDSQLLSLFLVSHHRQSCASKWAPYIASLPRSYTSVEWWTAEELDQAQNPSFVVEAAKRRAEVRREWRRSCEWIRETNPAQFQRDEAKESEEDDEAPLPLHWTSSVPEHVCSTADSKCRASSLCSLPSLAEFEWGWSTVATRSCFLPAVGSSSSEVAEPSSASINPNAVAINRSCLIPFLDMFNHSGGVHVEARLSASAYELFMVRPNPLRLSVGSEVFISYGALSNQKLLERYGFALGHNQHESMELPLSEVRTFLARPQPLWSAETLAQLKESWRISSGGGIESDQFMHCGCERHLDLSTALATHLPQWSRALPGFGRLESWQTEVLKACGLYEIAEQMATNEIVAAPAGAARRAAPARPSVAASAAATAPPAASSDATPSSPSSPPSSVSFRVDSCSLPFDLLTLVRVAVLSLDEAKAACGAAASASDASASRKQQSSGPSRSLDVPKLASLLLNEDRPYLSPGHRLLSHRLLIELLGSRLIDPRGLGRSSLQADVRAWEDRSSSSLSYIGSQALLLRLTQKRMLHSAFAHLCCAVE